MSERLAWLRERQLGIGGSDAPIVCGMSKWKTRYELYLEKTQPITRVPSMTVPQRVGLLSEPMLTQLYEEETGRSCFRPPRSIASKSHPFMRANLDAVSVDPDGNYRVVQMKTADRSKRSEWGNPGSDEIPDAYWVQVQHEMHCAEVDVADVPVLFGNQEFAVYTVQADSNSQEQIIMLEREFWEMVESRTPPDPETEGDIAMAYPVSTNGMTVEATDDDYALVCRLRDLRYAIAEMEKEKSDCELKLKKRMRDAEVLQHSGLKLATWKTGQRKSLDTKAFKAANEELYEEFSKVTDVRRFLIF